MKPITLITTALLGSLTQLAPAASQTDILRNRCAEQERQIKSLEKELDSLHALLAKNSPAPTKKSIAAATPKMSTSSYKIRKGDSLSKVARRNNVSLNTLLKANKGIHPNRLSIGQEIQIPTSSSNKVAAAKTSSIEVLPDPIKPTQHTSKSKPAAKTAAKASTGNYVVKKGDTLYHIARSNNTSVASILKQNKGLSPSKLRIGQSLSIASSKPAAATAAPKKAVAKAPTSKKAAAPVAKKKAPKATPVAKKAPEKKQEVQQISHTPKQSKVRTVSVTRQMTFGEFASTYGASVEQINEMNGLKLAKSTVLAQGSELYIPSNQL